MANTGGGMQFLGTILCGFILALPVILGYLTYVFIKNSVARRKERVKKSHTVI
ncbi:MAG: hypothetical protein ACTSPT_05820 [Candidatus Heimdallarchaeota archaeon]